nr:Rpn family recombination-promoting nuclease/putative transposase [Providencia rettgeri]
MLYDCHVITILNYLFIALDATNFEEVVQTLEEQTDQHRETIMSIAQRLQNKGRQEGIQQGREEGREEAKLTMAAQLLKNGVSPEIIMKSTGLNRDVLTSLQ